MSMRNLRRQQTNRSFLSLLFGSKQVRSCPQRRASRGDQELVVERLQDRITPTVCFELLTAVGVECDNGEDSDGVESESNDDASGESAGDESADGDDGSDEIYTLNSSGSANSGDKAAAKAEKQAEKEARKAEKEAAKAAKSEAKAAAKAEKLAAKEAKKAEKLALKEANALEVADEEGSAASGDDESGASGESADSGDDASGESASEDESAASGDDEGSGSDEGSSEDSSVTFDLEAGTSCFCDWVNSGELDLNSILTEFNGAGIGFDVLSIIGLWGFDSVEIDAMIAQVAAAVCDTATEPTDNGDGSADTGGSTGNNGLGNGEDGQPPGDPPVNDGSGTLPGDPGNQQP